MVVITIMMMVTRVINITTTIVFITIAAKIITSATVHGVLAIIVAVCYYDRYCHDCSNKYQ